MARRPSRLEQSEADKSLEARERMEEAAASDTVANSLSTTSIGYHDICGDGILMNARSEIEGIPDFNYVRDTLVHTIIGENPLVLGNSHAIKLIRWLMSNTNIGNRKSASKHAGCYVLLGASGSGKSTLIKQWSEEAIKSNLDIATIVASEPDYQSVSLAEGIVNLASCILTNKQVVLMDSIRGIVYSGEGSTLSGGVSSYLINFVEAVSRLATWSDSIVVLTVNPLQDNQDRYNMLREALKGSATGLIDLGNDSFTGRVNVTSRTFVNREEVTLSTENLSLNRLIFGSESGLSENGDLSVQLNSLAMRLRKRGLIAGRSTSLDASATENIDNFITEKTKSARDADDATTYESASTLLGVRMPHGYKTHKKAM